MTLTPEQRARIVERMVDAYLWDAIRANGRLSKVMSAILDVVLKEMGKLPAPAKPIISRRVTLHNEMIINGVRYEPGEYEMGRIGDPVEPTF